MALGYPELDPKAREVIAIDRFIDSLGDASLALKIRERTPATLDEALKAGQRQEIWNRDATRLFPEEPATKAIHATNEELLETVNRKIDQLQQQVDQVSRRQAKPIVVTAVGQTPANTQPPAIEVKAPATPTGNAATSQTPPDIQATPRKANTTPLGPRPNRWPRSRTSGTCFSCGAADHYQAFCPNKSPGKEERAPRTMPIQHHESGQPRPAKVYLNGHIKTHAVTALLDTGSDVSLAPYDVIMKSKCRLRRSAVLALKAANASDVIIAGEATVPLNVAGKIRHTVVYASEDVNEIILGSGWLLQHDCEWDFPNERIRFGPTGEWTPLTGRTKTVCSKIYADGSTSAEATVAHVVNRAGKKHTNADTLSRRPEPEAENASPSLPATCAVHTDSSSSSSTVSQESEPKPEAVKQSVANSPAETVGSSMSSLPNVIITLPEPTTTHAPANLPEESINVLPEPSVTSTTTTTPANAAANSSTEVPASSTATSPIQTNTDATATPTSRHRRRRRPAKNTPPPPPRWEDLAAAQMADDDLCTVYKCLKDNTTQPAIEVMLTESETAKRIWSQWHRLELQNEVLCRKFDDHWNNTTIYQAIIPHNLREKAIHDCHVGMTGGHLGIKKTLNQVQKRFYWTTWRSDTVRHCKHCTKCKTGRKQVSLDSSSPPLDTPNVLPEPSVSLPEAASSNSPSSSLPSQAPAKPPAKLPASLPAPTPANSPPVVVPRNDETQSLDSEDETILYETDEWTPGADQTLRKTAEVESDKNSSYSRFEVDPPMYRTPRPQRQRRLPRRYQD